MAGIVLLSRVGGATVSVANCGGPTAGSGADSVQCTAGEPAGGRRWSPAYSRPQSVN